ncbi:hypothetical protein [Calidifontibacillus oryziterrae]|uniref:hypothetical protein n=1 Tax=Calidifontibacillus oryziterrae TaxID=1191699 RepID=UPI0002D8E9CA|nr:hypothetical protein [Calidifontibacillus oryziterrae]
MFTVHFYEDQQLLLSQLSERAPAVDEDLKIKGRKGKVVKVQQITDRTINVEVALEKVKKKKLTDDLASKKKR